MMVFRCVYIICESVGVGSGLMYYIAMPTRLLMMNGVQITEWTL